MLQFISFDIYRVLRINEIILDVCPFDTLKINLFPEAYF